MKQCKNYKSRFPVGAGNDVGEVEFFSYLFKFLELINKIARLSHESGNLPLPVMLAFELLCRFFRNVKLTITYAQQSFQR